MRLITPFLLFLVLLTTQASAQDSTLIISQPVDIGQDGWNKVLQMSNGNTVLVHFENRKLIRTIVFDKQGKQIANSKSETKKLDLNILDNSRFMGFYEIGGNPVLFVRQQIDNVASLVRFVFNVNTGALVSESVILASPSFQKEIKMSLVKTSGNAGYAVVGFLQHSELDSVTITIQKYNEDNKLDKEHSYKLPWKEYDYFSYIGADGYTDGSVMAVMKTEKVVKFEKVHKVSVWLIYMPADAQKLSVTEINLADNISLSGMRFSKNEFNSTLNVLLNVSTYYMLQNGLDRKLNNDRNYLQLILPENMSSMKSKYIKFIKAKDYILKQGAEKEMPSFETASLMAYKTNDRGVTTTIHMEAGVGEQMKGYPMDKFGKYIITKIDDNGDEMAAIVLPSAHGLVYTTVYPSVFGKLSCRQSLHNPICLLSKNSSYVLYNDDLSKIDSPVSAPYALVMSFDSTDAILCHINRKNVLVKYPFCKGSEAGTHMQFYPDSEHFDEKTRMLAVVMRKKKGKEETHHLAWRRLED